MGPSFNVNDVNILPHVDIVNTLRHYWGMTERNGTYHHGDLRAALLAEAAAMIAEEGVAGVTMRELGRRLGVSRAAAYRHFEDKHALLLAVAAEGFEGLRERLQAAEAAAPRPSLERLRRMGEEYVRFALEHPAHYRLMYGKEAVTRRDVPVVREAANAIFELLVEVIRTHQRKGILKRGDPRAQAYVAWSAVHGLASLWIEGQIMATDDIDTLITQTTRTLLDGMRVRRRVS